MLDVDSAETHAIAAINTALVTTTRRSREKLIGAFKNCYAAARHNDNEKKIDFTRKLLATLLLENRLDLIPAFEEVVGVMSFDMRIRREILVPLYIKLKSYVRAQYLLSASGPAEITLRVDDLLALLAEVAPSQFGERKVWPNEQIAYPAKTGLLNASAIIMNKQKSLLAVLLQRLDSE